MNLECAHESMNREMEQEEKRKLSQYIWSVCKTIVSTKREVAEDVEPRQRFNCQPCWG
jgi:hypothetical protein